MKLTYQKDGIAPKLKLKRLQQVNLFLWKLTKLSLLFLILTVIVHSFMLQKKDLDVSHLQEFPTEIKRNYLHTTQAYTLLNNHKAPSVSLAILSEFIQNKNSIKEIAYRNTSENIIITFAFKNLSQELLEEEVFNLTQAGFFSSIKSNSSKEVQIIQASADPVVFSYLNTLPLQNAEEITIEN